MSYTNIPDLGTDSESDDGTDIFYGIGAYLSLSEAVNLKFEYQMHELDDADVDVLGLGVTVAF